MFERIRNMREDKDMTQTDMAKFLNIHQTTYSDYELGNVNFPIQVLIKIADLFDTSIDYLVERTNEKKPYKKEQNKVKKERRILKFFALLFFPILK